MARFFVEMQLTADVEVELPAEVVRHINVLRIRIHEPIILFNNTGYDYHAQLCSLDKRSAVVKINALQKVANESNLNLTLYMAIIANDKFDLVVQKAVELGVTKLVPIFCQNTQRFSADKLATKLEHWRKIIIASSEQSGRAVLMQVDQPLKYSAAITNDGSELKYILSPHHAGEFKPLEAQSLAVVVGPEGGLTHDEVIFANERGFNSVVLGNRILRAETAAISALGVLQYQYGDF